jgi:simple sugar transport system permease protein
LIDFLGATLRIATPLAFTALGGIVSEKAGVFAIGLEGMMLAGALGAAAGSFLGGGLMVSLIDSVVCGMAVGGVVAVIAVAYRADQIVTGLAANLLVLGLTGFIVRAGLGHGHAPVIHVQLLAVWRAPGLADLPVIGPVLFCQQPLTYLAVAATAALSMLLSRSRPGLLLRASGENPHAVYAAGGNPLAIRIAAVIAGAGLAGFGGAVLVLQQVGTFTDAMTGGRGFIALSAIVVGRWRPMGAIAACLVFAAAEAANLRLQGIDLPISSYIVQMFPYAISLAILAGLGRSVKLPAALGVAYHRNDSP